MDSVQCRTTQAGNNQAEFAAVAHKSIQVLDNDASMGWKRLAELPRASFLLGRTKVPYTVLLAYERMPA